MADLTPDWRAVTVPQDDMNESTESVSAEESGETPEPSETTLAVILAAGAGSRFNGPEHKLGSKLKKKPLLWWAATHALAAGFTEVLVVEGCIPVSGLVPDEVSIVHNHDWADGQSRSVQVAVHYADLSGYDTLVIGLADQPFVTPEAWRLVAASPSPIAVAKFDKQATPPVRLHSDVWGLLPLDGDEGARHLLRSRPELVTEVPCPGSAVDVDTVVEFDQVRRNQLTRELGSWT
ncbi:MAG: nucleotidyltransferase family protein [Acidimicrobiales bacterium]